MKVILSLLTAGALIIASQGSQAAGGPCDHIRAAADRLEALGKHRIARLILLRAKSGQCARVTRPPSTDQIAVYRAPTDEAFSTMERSELQSLVSDPIKANAFVDTHTETSTTTTRIEIQSTDTLY
jgi:hypothetical protein